MKNSTSKNLKVGAFVITSIILLVLAIYFIGSKNNLFSSKTYVTCVFKDIRGVIPGNSVRFSGIKVGSVTNIEITSDSTVEMTLAIQTKYAHFIYKNSIVEISQDGLMGNKLLIISSGTANMGHIKEGDKLSAKYGIDIENMATQARDILADAKSTVANLNLLTEKINNGEGDIGELLTKKTLSTKFAETADKLNSTLTNVNIITQKINSGEGDLGKLVNTNDITTETKSLLASLNQTSKKADNAVGELNQAARSINSGGGAISLLLNNKKTAMNVDTTIIKVNSSLEQFNKTAKAIEDSWIIRLFSKKKKTNNTTNTTTKTAKDSIK